MGLWAPLQQGKRAPKHAQETALRFYEKRINKIADLRHIIFLNDINIKKVLNRPINRVKLKIAMRFLKIKL